MRLCEITAEIVRPPDTYHSLTVWREVIWRRSSQVGSESQKKPILSGCDREGVSRGSSIYIDRHEVYLRSRLPPSDVIWLKTP